MITKDRTFRWLMYVSISLIALATLVTLILFWSKFDGTKLSNNISDWGAFGDFFGGILNIVIGLISLFVLAYVTSLVSQQSNEENRKQNILDKRIEVYGSMCECMTTIAEIWTKIDIAMEKIKYEVINLGNNEISEDSKRELRQLTFQFLSKSVYIDFFDIRYSYLFPIATKTPEYNELRIVNKKLENYHIIVEKSLNTGRGLPRVTDSGYDDDYLKKMLVFTFKLGEELDKEN